MINDTKSGKAPKPPEHRDIMARFDAAHEYDRLNVDDALDDLKFIAGDQWEEADRASREAANIPTITINRLPQFIRQVTGDMRQSRPQIKVSPVDDEGDKKKAHLLNGLIRQIERQSGADMVYTQAFENAVACGIGHFRIAHDYVQDSVADQDIFLRRIPSPIAVVWDPNATEIDRADARFCFVVETLSKDAFRELYPKAREESVPDNTGGSDGLFWNTGDIVRIAEYWYRSPAKKTLARLASGRTVEVTDGTAGSPQDPEVARREVDTFKVYSCIVSGSEILSGPHEFPSSMIPVVPVIGEEIFVGEKRIRSGLVRHAKDSQRMYNYWRSASAMSIAQAPKSPYLVTKKQIDGYESLWRTANTSALSYLPYNVDPQAPSAPQRIPPPAPPAALWQEAQVTSEEMKATTGIYDAALGAKSNETSGRAILARQREGDTGTFHFHDNLAHALRRAGQIIISMIPRIYDAERVVRLLNEDGSEAWETINRPSFDPLGNPIIENDVSVGRFDVAVSTGPSYTTQRIEAANAMIEFIRAFPPAAQVVGDKIAEMMDWPGADKIAARLRAITPPEIRAAIEAEEAKEDGDSQPAMGGQNALAAPPAPDPMQMAAMQQAQQVEQAQQMAQQQAAAEADAKMQHEAMKMDLELQKKRADAMAAEYAAQMKIQQADMELAAERERTLMDLELERAKLANALVRLQPDPVPTSAPMVVDEPVSEPSPTPEMMTILGAIDRIDQTMAMIGAAMTAPKRVIYNDAGRVAGVETMAPDGA